MLQHGDKMACQWSVLITAALHLDSNVKPILIPRRNEITSVTSQSPGFYTRSSDTVHLGSSEAMDCIPKTSRTYS